MPHRTFTFEEARDLMPWVRERTQKAVDEVASLSVALDDADDPEEAEEAAQDALRQAAGEILGRWASELDEKGIEVKGPWLVDFDSGAGYYCWKWPEESLQFFHSYEEGFAGRVRLQ